MSGRLRAWIIALGGAFLILPLVGLVCAALWWSSPKARLVHGGFVVPMLSAEEQRNTLTYLTECRTDGDCDPRLRCFFNVYTAASYCAASSCVTDSHCPKGLACQLYSAENHRDLIMACTLVGPQKEGEMCELNTRELAEACEQGLVCRGRCGRLCDAAGPAACPEGFFCEEAIEGASCQPTCAGRSCPEGQQCVSLGGQRSICAKVHGQTCEPGSCGPGQRCWVRDYPEVADEVWRECVQLCDLKDAAPCPESTTCVVHRCLKRCTPDDPAACGEGFKCSSPPGLPAICSPDVPKLQTKP